MTPQKPQKPARMPRPHIRLNAPRTAPTAPVAPAIALDARERHMAAAMLRYQLAALDSPACELRPHIRQAARRAIFRVALDLSAQ